jgi:hypothetical protein
MWMAKGARRKTQKTKEERKKRGGKLAQIKQSNKEEQ